MEPKLLVPLDGSSSAEQALLAAAWIARRTGTKLHLAMVLPQLPVRPATGEEAAPEPAVEQELRQQSLHYLEATADVLGTTHGLNVTYALLNGAPVHALAEHARIRHVSLIIMTTHGQGGLSRLWLGSVADRLLRRVRVPILLVRPADGVPRSEFRHTLVALDGLAEGERILEPAIALGSLGADSRFTLVQVLEPPASLITCVALSNAAMRPPWRDVQEGCARSYLERIAVRMRKRGLCVGTQVLSGLRVGEGIVALAQTIGADLLVVGTHSARGASQAVLVVPTLREEG